MMKWFCELKLDICRDNNSLKWNTDPLYLIPNQDFKTININSDGFRGNELQVNPDYRIFLIGGSTTFGVGSTSDSSTIPYFLQEKLIKQFPNLNIEVINAVKIHKAERSNDGTIKYSLALYDNKLVEGVLIPSKKRITACVSSQVGCSLACTFCATGTLKLERNLNFSEIYDQVFILNEEATLNFGRPLSNIVFMGMGEPLLNYDNLLKSIHLITNTEGLSMSPKRITVSTVGIAKMIRKLADDNIKFNYELKINS